MKVFAANPGEPDVGIPSATVELKFDVEILDDNSEMREFIRTEFGKLAGEIVDGGVVIWFDDECPDCQIKYKTEEKICENTNCISFY